MKRFAVYYSPRPGAFADRVAGWLGWDVVAGAATAQPQIVGLPAPLADLTAEPRKYGFHGTIRAPFRLAVGLTAQALSSEISALAQRLPPVPCKGLRLENLEGFLALIPEGCQPALQELGAAVVEGTNSFRAPLTKTEIARRQPDLLTARQRTLLEQFGYPYVMEEFRFHLTLTGRLPAIQADAVARVLRSYLAPVLPTPFVIEDLCLMGEDAAGRFHLISRHALTG